jgi:hypothetical protein
MTGKPNQASLQSALYKIRYFVFLAVFLLALLLTLRVALLQRDQVKLAHLTVSPPLRVSKYTYHKDHANSLRS